MKYLLTLILILTSPATHAGIPGLLTQEARDWRFIQSVGGMKISLTGRLLEVDCDVSGMRNVTIKPTLINSGIGVRQLKHKQVGGIIQITLITSVIEKGMTSSCKPLDLSDYPAGKYSIEYLNRDGTTQPLGKIDLLQKPAIHKATPK